MFGKKLFGGHISPACEYCRYGEPSADNQMILCPKKGIVAPYFACRRFSYDPLKRVPKRRKQLPSYSPEDFAL